MATSTSAPHPELPNDILESILERLPLSAYTRFGAVCKKWRLVQLEHRRRQEPLPPPMVKLPWLIFSDTGQDDVLSYSPFEKWFYRLPLPFSWPWQAFRFAFAHGWLLTVDSFTSTLSHSLCLTLFNPISRAMINLMPLYGLTGLWRPPDIFAISTPPNYAVSIFHGSSVFLIRRMDYRWSKLPLAKDLLWNLERSMAVSCGGKHYCISGDYFLVIDPLAADPAIEFHETMKRTKLKKLGLKERYTYLVECNGEPLLVIESCSIWDRYSTVGFRMFRADLREKAWVEVESLGDQALIIHELCAVSVLAADVRLERNCIYFSCGSKAHDFKRSGEDPWKLYDLSAEKVKAVENEKFPNESRVDKYSQQIFVPSIC